MTGIIDVGGGSRGIYGAGVFDRCIDEGITFDCCIGVSAGSANIVSFLGGQKGRNYLFYTEYAARKAYMSMRNFLHCGAYIDLNYVYGVLSNADGENPLNYEGIRKYDGIIRIPATCEDGNCRYFTENDLAQDDYHAVSASSSLPYVCQPCIVDGTRYFDGGISDPVPLQKALDEGCDRVVLILTRPLDEPIRDEIDKACAAILKPHYPLLAAVLQQKAERYKQSIALAKRLEKTGVCRIIAPQSRCGVDTLSRNKRNLDALYAAGYADAEKIRDFLFPTQNSKAPSAS